MTELRRIARDHALATIGRTDEMVAHGQIQIPHTPRQADYDALSNDLAKTLTDAERTEYEDQFFHTLRQYLAENYPADMVEEWAGRR